MHHHQSLDLIQISSGCTLRVIYAVKLYKRLMHLGALMHVLPRTCAACQLQPTLLYTGPRRLRPRVPPEKYLLFCHVFLLRYMAVLANRSCPHPPTHTKDIPYMRGKW